MMSSVPEKDWKLLRKLQKDLTNRACDLIFIKVDELSSNRTGAEHKSYLDLYKLIKNEDKKIAQMFDHLSRNNALMNIFELKRFGVLSSEEFEMFSQETQDQINKIFELRAQCSGTITDDFSSI